MKKVIYILLFLLLLIIYGIVEYYSYSNVYTGNFCVTKQKIEEQAEKYGHSKERELAFLTAHSMMHLFGYDHMEEDEAKVMEAKQREVLELLGITR